MSVNEVNFVILPVEGPSCIPSVRLLPSSRASSRHLTRFTYPEEAILSHPWALIAYSAAKAGLIGMTVGLAAQLETHGILVNAIMPGVIGSTGTPLPEGLLKLYERKYPLGAGGPEPVAHAVAYLLEPSGDWISGVAMNVSGGLVMGM